MKRKPRLDAYRPATLSAAMVRALNGRRNKFGAKKATADGYTFDSTRERDRYLELKLLERTGEIRDLLRQPSFVLAAALMAGAIFDYNEARVTGRRVVATYRADFMYITKVEQLVVEDVKSKPTRTALYRLKRKLFEANYGFAITEVE